MMNVNETVKVKRERPAYWRLHCKKELVLELKAVCDRLGMSRRAFVDELVQFGIQAAGTSCGRFSVLRMLQEAARKEEDHELQLR